ncbi:MAG: AraC family transcriptional regulator, partial [Mycoplasmataceae bacterium]|nr:AraC family transcriptional regulator [Mycoplasmataceae bacterium]
SKENFKAEFHIFSCEDFLLSRETLQGTIEHKGESPKGYRTIVIPINYGNELVWFDKKLAGTEFLIFPEDEKIDAITYDNLDIYLISIREELLIEIITQLNYKNCKRIFNGDVRDVIVDEEFTQIFHEKSDLFLNANFEHEEEQQVEIKEIALLLLQYLDSTEFTKIKTVLNKQDIALKKATSIIHSPHGELISVQKLGKLVGVSNRTLYNAFKNRYKVSTSEYIKAIRLNKVKKELFVDGETNISKIAGKYHFWHMGQFAKDFKSQFGLLPSAVINNSDE